MKSFFTNICVIVYILFSPVIAMAQNKIITGKVTSYDTNQPLEAAIVAEKGTTNATQTTANGTYTLTISDTSKVIVFILVGYEKKEVQIGNERVINATLKSKVNNLDETVVVAYGEARKSEISGSQTRVGSREIEDIPIASIDLILQGKVAGLYIESNSGQPGGSANVVLRGIGSISAGSNPLYVVDGIPINKDIGVGVVYTANGLAGVNPEDIEDITVLKDASATAIYGSRGGNGVILITTKKGKAGKTQFHFDYEYGVNNIAYDNIAKPLNATQFTTLTRQGLMNAGYTDSAANVELNGLGANRGANTDWLKEVTQSGRQKSYNLSVEGGDEKTQFYISGGYFSQQGNTISSYFDRYSGSLKLNHRVNKRLKFGANLIVSSHYTTTPYQSAFFRSPIMSAYFNLPYMRPYDSTGKPNISTQEFYAAYNPIAISKYDNNHLRNTKVIGGVDGEYKIAEGLKFTSNLSLDVNNTNELTYNNPFYGDAAATQGYLYQANNEQINWVWTNMLQYQKKFKNDDISVNIKAGHEAQQSQQNDLEAGGVGFPPNTTLQVLSVASTPKTAYSLIDEYSFESYFSNASVAYQSKYLLTGSYRNDGSSRFGINNRYGNFYSVGGSWIISKENFMKNIKVISTLRLRSSYGQNGNASIGSYAWLALSGYTTGASYNGNTGSNPTNPGNNNLTWEKNNPFDIGIDGGLFNDRLIIGADYYNRKTSDLLLNVPVSLTTGFSSKLANVGAMQNKGLELTLSAAIIKSKPVTWNANFNIAFNTNKITELYNNEDIINSNHTILRVGESAQTFYMPLWAGVDPATGGPLWYTDSTRKTTTSDVANAKASIAGNFQPKYFGAFTNTLSWKNFTLSFQVNFVMGGKVYDRWARYLQSDGANPSFNQTTAALSAWTKPGMVTDVPEYVYGNTSNSNYASTRYIYDGSYIRIKHLTLAYNCPSHLLSKYKINVLNVYLKVTNLYTWVKDKRVDFDPDVTNGVGDLNIPNIRSVIGGIKLSF